MNERPVIEVRCIRHVYPDRTEVDLCGLDFDIDEGIRAVILGANGSGKTTLLLHMMGLLSAVEGRIKVFGLDPVAQFDELKKRIGVVFQSAEEQIIAPTVMEDVSFTPRSRGWDPADVEERTSRTMEELGILHLRDKLPHYLSGGERKKVALAGAIVTEPELLILDEPFNGLDPVSRREITGILNGINSRIGTTIVLTTHDINLVPHLADKVFVIDCGDVVFSGPPAEAFNDLAMLRRAGLEPPILVELTEALRQRGIDVPSSISIEEAADAMAKLLQRMDTV